MLRRVKKLLDLLVSIDSRLDRILVNQGLLLESLRSDLDDEWGVFSQNGEDSILAYLLSKLGMKGPNHYFVEFGVEDFVEANCRYLLQTRNWSGLVLDGSEKNIARLKGHQIFWKHDLQALNVFVTAENIGHLLFQHLGEQQPDLISVDIDGMDYWVVEAMADFRPSIFVVEFNSTFGMEQPLTVPYSMDFVRSEAHYSNLYYGASLPAFKNLLLSRGYFLAAVNLTASNAFFVRRDVAEGSGLREIENLSDLVLTKTKTRESRNKSGHLSFLSPEDREREIGHLPLINLAEQSVRRDA